jgi:CTP synthase (UTP-ammonia lyase)
MRVAIIGDFEPKSASHTATNEAIRHSTRRLGISPNIDWIDTDTITMEVDHIAETYDSFLIARGGRHRDRDGILKIIEYARRHDKPTLGTCGGFQQMVVEYARNVLGITDAGHAEYEPDSSRLLVTPLCCNLKEGPLEIDLTDKASAVFEIYGTGRITAFLQA